MQADGAVFALVHTMLWHYECKPPGRAFLYLQAQEARTNDHGRSFSCNQWARTSVAWCTGRSSINCQLQLNLILKL